MRRAATRFVGSAVALLAVAGVAQGQETQTGVAPQARPSSQPAEPGAGSSGILGRIEAGLSEVLTGERLVIHVNGAYERSSRQHEAETVARVYGEQSRLLARESFHGGGHIDLGGSLRVWRRLALGVSFTQVRNSGRAEVSGTVPHPLETDRDRTAPMQSIPLPQRQRAFHGYLAWRVPLLDVLEVEMSAGPTYYSLRQAVVASLAAVEVGGPPFSEVGLVAGSVEHTRNGGGFHAGIDVTYMLTPATRIPQLGIGYFARLTTGSVSLPIDERSGRRVSVGGIQTGAGLRLRF